MDRPTIDETMLATAEIWARRATCSRLSVGAVLARDGHVLTTAYNGAPAGVPHCSHADDEPCAQSVHAEANALLWAARYGVSALGATLYVTHAPCLGCSGHIINAGIENVIYRHDYRSSEGLWRLSARLPGEVKRLSGGVYSHVPALPQDQALYDVVFN